MRRLPPIREERGTTLIELLVAIPAGVIVLFAITTTVIIVMHETARATTHVEATQRARTVVADLIEELHSSCIAADIAPVKKESSGTELRFIHQTGSAVSPTPILSKVKLSGGTLTQYNYSYKAGTAPYWTFNEEKPNSTEELMTNISPTSPSSSIFFYYSYTSGEVSATPLTTPLSEANAEVAVEVKVALTAAPPSTPIVDKNAAANITDSALLRFTPAPYNTAVPNLPCQ